MSVDFKFLQSLHDNYKGLTPSEIFFLILFHEGYDDAAVMNILAVSNTALRVRKSRINKKKLNKDAWGADFIPSSHEAAQDPWRSIYTSVLDGEDCQDRAK